MKITVRYKKIKSHYVQQILIDLFQKINIKIWTSLKIKIIKKQT